jgi:glycosyltransferase involved in cell wall biosynthesis
MKIALTVHDLHNHGGHSAYTKVLADEFSQRHEVTVFANHCERPANARWRFQHVQALRSSALTTVLSFPAGLRLHERRLRKYDIRHAQGYCGDHPNVVTAHICVAAYLASLREVSYRHRFTLQRMAEAESRFYRRYQGKVIAVSQKIAGELQEYYGVTNSITVVPHGVDVGRFETGSGVADSLREQLGIEPRQTMLLYVGDLTKSHFYLKRLARAAPWLVLVVVSYSQSYRWKSENVRFLSSTRELGPYYAAADAFVFPTAYDAFGMVLLEAMAAGLPVFTSDCAGAAELIRPGKDGFVFPLKDWVEATLELLKDRARLQTVGGEARTTAGRQRWSKVVREVEQVYFDYRASNPQEAEAALGAYTCL